MLAQRLIQGSSVSEVAERGMIGKLREVYDYTGKLKQMLTDMDTMKDLDEEFSKWRPTSCIDLAQPSFTARYKVLSTATWPLTAPNTSFVVPLAIGKEHQKFIEFYRNKHPGRKLLWLWHLCHGELTMHSKHSGPQGYTLQASGFQIGIFLLFNEHDELSRKMIEESTSLNPKMVDALLTIFLKTKLLNCKGSGDSQLYSVNKEFKSKKIKINILYSIKSQKNHELVEINRKIKQERYLLIQASASAVMRRRKTD
jgi:cullin 1